MFNKIKSKWQQMSLTGRLVLTAVLMFVGITVAFASPLRVTDGLYMTGDRIDIVDVGRNVLASFSRSVSGGGNVELNLSTGRLQNRDLVAFTTLDATPSVKFGNYFKTANAGATTITALDDCENGQEVTIIITDVNTGITDGGTLWLAGNVAAGAGTVNDTLSLVCSTSGNAYETSRSVN